MRAVTVRLDEGLLARVDACRGGVPRERWIREAIWSALGGGDVGCAAPERAPDADIRRIVRPAREFVPYPKRGDR